MILSPSKDQLIHIIKTRGNCPPQTHKVHPWCYGCVLEGWCMRFDIKDQRRNKEQALKMLAHGYKKAFEELIFKMNL